MVTKLVLHLRPNLKASAESKELNWETFKDYLLDNYLEYINWFDTENREYVKQWRVKPEKHKECPNLSVVDKDGGSPAASFITSLLATVDKEDERAGWNELLSGAYHKFPPFDKNKKFRGGYFFAGIRMFGSKAFGGTDLKPIVFDEWEKIFEKWKARGNDNGEREREREREREQTNLLSVWKKKVKELFKEEISEWGTVEGIGEYYWKW